jgi:peptidoglycan/LPS O-acetylase OafA/YrhL
MTDYAIDTRRADLDWLRVIAFGLLIYFHAAIAFVPGGIPMIQNAEASPVLQVFVAFLQQFRLALLFLISGVGVRFALKHRDGRQFMRDRSVRLLAPLAFGILVLVPPMVYLEKRFIGEFQGTFLGFYPAFFTSGVYPRGHLSWHHFWFLAYLFLFCVIGWPLFRHLRTARGVAAIQVLVEHVSQGGRLWYLPILVLALVEIPLRGVFPGFRDLIHDWASFSHWFAIFVSGFIFASGKPLLDRAQHLRRGSLVFALLTTGILFVQFYSPAHSSFSPQHSGPVDLATYVWFCVVKVANVWFWLLACLGYAGRYLRHATPLLNYLNEAVYPLFCVHLPIIVALAYLIVPHCLPVAAKYLAITTGTVVASLAAYELARRPGWLRPLVGLKPQHPPHRPRLPPYGAGVTAPRDE